MKFCICFTRLEWQMSPNAKVIIITRPYKRASGFWGDSTTKDFHPWIGDSPFHPRKLPICMYIVTIVGSTQLFESSGWRGGQKSPGTYMLDLHGKRALSSIIYVDLLGTQGKDLRTCEMYHPRIQMRLIMFDPRDIMASSVACFSASSLSFACLRRCWNYILYWVVGGPKSTRRHCVLC